MRGRPAEQLSPPSDYCCLRRDTHQKGPSRRPTQKLPSAKHQPASNSERLLDPRSVAAYSNMRNRVPQGRYEEDAATTVQCILACPVAHRASLLSLLFSVAWLQRQ